MGKAAVAGGEALIQIIYTSVASVPFTADDLTRLLATARTSNHAHQVSGLLVFDDGFFIQTLEGPESRVDQVFRTIEKDTRHDHLRLLLRHRIDAREFADWTMGFVDTSALPARLDGFVPYCTLKQTVRDGSQARRLVGMFQEGRWRQAVSR